MLTHMNEKGYAKMVDVSDKNSTTRVARASGKIYMKESTIELINNKEIKKGDVFSVAQVAGIMGAKQTPNIIPMCHSLNLSGCDIEYIVEKDYIKCDCIAKVQGQTGVEMEAIMGVSVALTTIYDMCKAVDKDMVITDIRLEEKIGGKSGHYLREDK